MDSENSSDSNDDGQKKSKYVATLEKYKWTSKAVKLLLTLRFQKEHEFTHPLSKKIHVWDDISKELAKHGFNFSGHNCFAKYRNLCATYRRRKQMGHNYRWEHFDLMDLHLGGQVDNTETEIVEETPDESHSYYIIQQVEIQGDGVEDLEIHRDKQKINGFEILKNEPHIEDVETQGIEEHAPREIQATEDDSEEEQESKHIKKTKGDKGIPVENNKEAEFQWCPESTKLLLSIRLSKNYQWLKPNAKKIELWKSLSNEMKEHNFNVPGHHCDMKYRNLLKTYRNNKDRLEKGEGCTWQYFELMDSYLDHELSGNVTSLMEQRYTSSSKTNVHSVFNNIIQDSAEEREGDKKVSGIQWTPPAIRLLLNLRLERECLFNKPLSRKLKLYDEISEEMQNKGFEVPANACSDKWRNLLTTYRKIKQKVTEYGDKSFVRWEYFDLIDSYLGHIPYTPLKKLVKTDLTFNDLIQEVQREEETRKAEEDYDEEESSIRKRPKLTISEFLERKLIADEKKAKDYLALEEKKLKLEYQKLELEQKKIDVLKSLVTALKQAKK